MGKDSGILSDFRRGELRRLYERMYRPLLMYASKCLTINYSFLAEDCVQHAIFKAYEARHGFPSESALVSYLYTTVHRKTIDIVRKGRSRANYLNQLPVSSDEFLSGMLEHETMQRLFEVLDTLPQDDRDLFFRFADGEKIEEIARALQLSESAVKRRKAKMIDSLRQVLRNDDLLLLLLLSLVLTAGGN